MIAWLQPSALWALALLALPVAIHLLRTRHADRVPFPSTRFVQPSRTAAVRVRPPSDLILLAMRMGIVALAAMAAAQPLWLSASRRSEWNGRTARAIVVDTSDSMRAGRRDNRTPADDVEAVAGAEERTGIARRFDSADLAEGVRRAAAWLRVAPPARREIVVISDFQLGSLSEAVLEGIDGNVGLRFIPVEGDRRPRSIAGPRLLATAEVPGRSLQTRITPEGTQLSVSALPEGGGAPYSSEADHGLRLVGGDDRLGRERLLATLAAAGTPAPDPGQPMAVLFTPASAPAGATRPAENWMLQVLAAVERDRELTALGRDIKAADLRESESWTVLIRDRAGRPLVRAAAIERELVLQVGAPMASYFAAAATRVALVSRPSLIDRSEQEVLRIPAATLSAWSRSPGPAGESAWRQSDESDARWLWCGALALLVLEHWFRRRSIERKDEARAAA